MDKDLIFDDNAYCIKELTIKGETLRYRAYEGIVYVARPNAEKYQSLNVFVPECYYQGGEIHGYTLKTAPIFFPNTVGGYMPGLPKGPEVKKDNDANLMAKALFRGYVVICAGTRGRGLKDEQGRNIGVAPAHIVDLKAAVRYLKWNKDVIPGDTNKIISNGTSAGGALSCLLGTTGNHSDFEAYLQEIGAAPGEDDIFASSCYCPITNLEHADMAYEWEFCGINEGSWWHGDFVLTEEQIDMSKKLKESFPKYLKSLRLRDMETGDIEDDELLKKYILVHVKDSAQKALEGGEKLSIYDWIHIKKDGLSGEDVVISIDWDGYIRYRKRMKPVPAFDNITLGTPENELFGSAECDNRHFTEFSAKYRENENQNMGEQNEKEFMAEARQIKMLNPMNYIRDKEAKKAKHFRIRHGAIDRDTSLAISAIIAIMLDMEGIEVDYFLPWGIPHAGDYDAEELFEWIEKICKV